jgi:glutamyl-tRNA synthetase
MVNFLALLGWSLDDRTELLSREKLVKNFSLDRVGKTGAIFNKEKLEWMNGVYLRKLSLAEFIHQAIPFLDRDLPESATRPVNRDYVGQVLALIQERTKTLAEVPRLADFFFIDVPRYETGLFSKVGLDDKSAIQAIMIALQKLEMVTTWDATALESVLRTLATELDLRTREFFGLLRTAITGRTAAPPLFETMAVLGKERCLERLKMTLQVLPAHLN